MKKVLTQIFLIGMFSTPARKNYPTNEIIYGDNDEIWS